MSYDLKNKLITSILNVEEFRFEIKTNENSCSFYCWTDENATLSTKEVRLYRVNVNLSEVNEHNLKIDVNGFQCLAKHGEYLIFKSKSSATYLVCSTSVNYDYNNEFSIKNPSKKAVECSFVDDNLTFNVKDLRMFTNHACLLDIWIVVQKNSSDSILEEITKDLCL